MRNYTGNSSFNENVWVCLNVLPLKYTEEQYTFEIQQKVLAAKSWLTKWLVVHTYDMQKSGTKMVFVSFAIKWKSKALSPCLLLTDTSCSDSSFR